MKILHLADVHLDSTFSCRSESVRGLLRRSLEGAFIAAVDCAIEEEVDAVVIAGDLFDGELLTFRTERFLVEQTGRLGEAGIMVVVACGNHDPGGRRGRIANIGWPPSVRVLRGSEPEIMQVPPGDDAPKGYIIAAGHEAAHEERNLARAFPGRCGPEPHVGVLHTLVTNATDAGRHDRYAPCTVEDLVRAGYDYWALGHVHTRQQVADSTGIWYSGSVQGRSPREPGPRGGLLVDLSSGNVSVQFRAFAELEWMTVSNGDLADANNLSGLLDRIESSFEDARADDSAASRFIVRIDLEGPCPLSSQLRTPDGIAELEEAVRARLDVDHVEIRSERLRPPVSVEGYRGEVSLAGEVLALVEEMRTDDRILLDLVPEHLAAGPVGDPDATAGYLRELTSGAEAEVIGRLIDTASG